MSKVSHTMKQSAWRAASTVSYITAAGDGGRDDVMGRVEGGRSSLSLSVTSSSSYESESDDNAMY